MTDSVSAAIHDALTAYYEALYYGRPDRLDDAFTADAVLLGYIQGKAVQVDIDQYRTVLASRPSPHSRGEPYAFTVREVRRCGGVAVAELATPLNGIVFTDYASLVLRDGRWRIACKVYSHDQQGGH